MTPGTPCDREKARAILAHVGRLDEFDRNLSYWIERTEDGRENLVTYGGDVVATNRETTSWTSPGFPPRLN
jgi:hypothetical protein